MSYPPTLGVWARKGPTPSSSVPNITGNGDAFTPYFDDIKAEVTGGAGFGLQTSAGANLGKYKCAESGIWTYSGSIIFGNIASTAHTGGTIWIHTGMVEPFLWSGSPSAVQCLNPPAGGADNLMALNFSFEFPIDVTVDPWIFIVAKINGGTKQISYLYDSWISVSKKYDIP